MKKIGLIATFFALTCFMLLALASCDALTGPQGEPGEQGEKGADGNSIVSIEKTSSDGLIDTYTITFTNGITSTFTVTNGEKGEQGDKGDTGAQGEKGDKGDTGAQGEKGDKGDTGAQGEKGDKGDTGAQGEKGDKGDTGAQGEKGDKGDTGAQGEKGDKGDTGNGIFSIEKTSSDGLVDTYTITFTNGTTTTFTIKNGANCDKCETESESGSSGTGGSTEVERFDYMGSDMNEYISIDESTYKGVTVTLPTYLNGSDEAVAEYINVLREAYPQSTGNKITDRAIKEGDTVALYYEGWLNGEKFEGSSNMDDEKPYSLTIGSGAFIPGFEEGLIGLVPQDYSRDNLYDLHVTFPESYHSADLAGKAVIFKVYVEYIDEKAPAEYTDTFIKDTLGYKTNATDVKADFEKYLKETYLPSMKENEIANSVWNEITEKAVVKAYPEGELEYVFSSYENQYKQYYQYYSSMFSSYEEFMKAYLGSNWKSQIEEQCKIDVEQNLIFHYIAQVEGMTVSEADYNDAVQYYIDYYTEQGQTLTAKDVEEYFGSRMIKEQALWTKVQTLLVESCVIVYENK